MSKGAILNEKGVCLTDVSSFLTYLNNQMLYTFGSPCLMYQTHLPKPEQRKAYPEIVIAWLDEDMNLLSYYGLDKTQLSDVFEYGYGKNCYVAELKGNNNNMEKRKELLKSILDAADVNLCSYIIYNKEL